jgi:tryptophanyl-tRNA synthetase
MKARTDEGPATENAQKPNYIENLFTLMKIVSASDVYNKFNTDYNNSSKGNCVIRYGDFKKQLAEDMANFIQPIRNKTNDLLNDKTKLQTILKHGKEKARESAANTLTQVRAAMGVNY